jgi:hypothetical protein
MGTKNNLIKTGKCIWCGKSVPDVTFTARPHILPQKLGGEEIGTDVCDDCNHYFGKATKGIPAVDVAFKEIFNAFRTFGKNMDENTYKHFKSIFFEYRHSKSKIIIKKEFNSIIVTRQFKRGLYEVFLQKYHAVTNNGNHPMFDFIRRFARYNEGDPHVFYAFNNIVFTTKNDEHAMLTMSEKVIDDMMKYGVFCLWLFGHIFYLEIFPIAFRAYGMSYLQQEARNVLIRIKGNESIYELKDVMDIDFCMERFNS